MSGSSSPCASALAEAAEATRQGENRWKAALEGAGAGVWDWDMETNRVFYSRPWKTDLLFCISIENDSELIPD